MFCKAMSWRLRWGWGNPLGKLHRQGLQLFQSSGWQAPEPPNQMFHPTHRRACASWQAIGESDDSVVPAFCWPTRRPQHYVLRQVSGEAQAVV